MHNFRDLEVWQRAHATSIEINLLCRQFPRFEQYCLASQMRRSSTSVAFNIAEGFGRKVALRSNADLLHFLSQSSGSLHELDNQVEYAWKVSYVEIELATRLLADIATTRRKMGRLITYLRENDRERPHRR
jgi:four helix bundle protein